MQLFCEGCGTGHGHEQGEALQPSIIIIHKHLHSFTCRTRRHDIHSKENQEKTTLKDKGVRLDLLGLYGAGLGRPNESRETVKVTCTLEGP